MSLEQLTEGVRGKVAGGGIEESVKFDLGGDGVIFLQGSDVSNDDAEADCTIKISAEDLGSEHPRKVNYFPRTGRVLVRRLASVQQQEVAARERSYQATICKKKEAPGAIELFD